MNDTTTLPAIGDRIYVRPVNRDWVGIATEYRTVIGTVSAIDSAYPGGRPCIHAEFRSRTKPDDTIEYGFYDWTHACVVGDVVKAYDIPMFEDKEGSIVTISSVLIDEAEGRVDYNAEFEGVGRLSFRKAIMVRDGDTITVSDTTEAEPIPADLHHSQIERLERELERANERVEALSSRAGKWERDFGKVTAAILQEAIDRDWCEEYERVMGNISDSLEIGEIPEREQEFEVEIEITASVSYSTTVTVTARSQENADEMVSNDVDSYVDAESVLTENHRYISLDNVECEVQ